MTEQTNYYSALFPELDRLPSGWTWAKIGEIAKEVNSGFPSGKHNQNGVGVPHLRPMNISPHGELSFDLVKYVEVSDEEYDALCEGDVLFNNTNSPDWLGKTTYIRTDSRWAYSNHMTRIRLYEQVNAGWVAHSLHYLFLAGFFRLHCRNHVNQASINTTFLSEETSIPLPPLPEQQRIVEAIEAQFTRLDAATQGLKRLRTNLQRYRQSVLKAACEGTLVPTEAELAAQEGREYEPASVLLDRILAERRKAWEGEEWQKLIERAQKKVAQAQRKAAGLPYYIRDMEPEDWLSVPEMEYEKYLPKNDKWKKKYKPPKAAKTEDLSELPEGWEWTTVEQIANVIGGLTKNSKRKRYPLKLPYLRVANVYANKLELDDVATIGLKETELERILLAKDDLLVVEGNGSPDQIGRVAIWNGSIDPCVHQNHLIKVRFFETQIVEFVLYWLLSVKGREQILKVASSTSGLYTLSLSKVSALPIPLPPLAEQQRIVEEVERRLSVVDQHEQVIAANQKRAERLRQAILKRAFEGRLVPQDPSDEPASVLLERIQAQNRVESTESQMQLFPSLDDK